MGIIRKLKKFHPVLPYVVGVSIFGVFLYILLFRKVKPFYTSPFGGSTVNVPLDTCDSMSGIDYYSYKDIPEEEKRNNKFGLYIYAEQKEFFDIAKKLVNSNGGDWGYVLIPYNIKDLDGRKWQGVFSRLSQKHLIPVLQLWDVDPDNYKKDTRKAAEFLNSFAWPIRQRYVSVYNETNDSRFWRGEVDPQGYAKVLDFTIETFKKENENFFMINGAFNVTAPTDGSHMEAFTYMYYMNEEVPGIFERLDGWASHPYPQPNFSGSPEDEGRWSIRAYEEELEYLEQVLKLEKDLPVFITETGWAHAEGEIYNSDFLPVSTVAQYFRQAFEDVWLKDDRVRAVMPFTIRYDPPFDHFSWVNKDGVPYIHYETLKKIEKVKGNPESIEISTVDYSECL